MSDDKINAETYRGWLQPNGYIQIRESDESNAVLKELEPEILSGAVIGTVVIYRAERWQVIIQKDFYEKNKSNPESLTGVVKKAIDQLFIEEQRSNFVLPKGEQIVLEQFADGETRKSLLWAEDGGCVIQHFEEGKNGVYPLYLERIFPLDKNQILIYKRYIFYLLVVLHKHILYNVHERHP